MRVYVNKHDRQGNVVGRTLVEADILEERKQTLLVRLPDGHVVVRKKNRDLPDHEKQP